MMKTLIVKIIIFLIPVSVLLAVPISILYKLGELYSISEVIDIQNETKGLYGSAYSNSHTLYKILKTKETKPRVLVLGTSRTMQFRDFFFTKSFYNAGGGIYQLSDYQKFFSQAYNDEDLYPSLLLISLDQYFFNEAWVDNQSSDFDNRDIDIYSLNKLQKVTRDIFTQRIPFSLLVDLFVNKEDNVGVTAIVHRDGFRMDGSYCYNRIITQKQNSQDLFEDVFQRIKGGTMRFEYGNNIYEKQLDILDDFLDFCQSKNIYVVAFLPSYPTSVWTKMKDSGKYTYIDKLSNKLPSILKKHEYSFFDYSDMAQFGSGDEEAIDGFHGSEKTMLRSLIDMTQKDTTLLKYVDINKLNLILKASNNNYSVYH